MKSVYVNDRNLIITGHKIKVVADDARNGIFFTDTATQTRTIVAALTGYKLFGAAASAGIPGSDAIYDSLKARFTSSSAPKPDTPDESAE